MKQVLVPIDFFDDSYENLRFVVDLAAKIGAIITISKNIYVNVISDINANKLTLHQIVERKKKEYVEQIEERINKYRDELYVGSKKTIQFRIEVEEGLIDDTLSVLTQRRKYDLILLSNDGFNHLTDLLWKRKKSIIADNVKSSVLVIPKDYQYKDFINIYFITNQQRYDESILGKLNEIAYCFNAEVTTIDLFDNQKQKELDPDLFVFFINNVALINSFFNSDNETKITLKVSKPVLFFCI